VAVLTGGSVRIDLDPVFAAAIVQPYVVLLTPYADAALFVAEIGDGYFVVKVRDGDPNAQFAWRVSAPRKGYDQLRLEPATPPAASARQGEE
jgi:hypothetical protein